MPRPIPPFPRRYAGLLVSCAGPARARFLRRSLGVANGPVNAERIVGNTLILGGVFDAVGTQVRGHLAHFGPNGNLTAWSPIANGPVYVFLLFAGRLWNPNADGDVHALAPLGSTFLVGGPFGHIGAVAREPGRGRHDRQRLDRGRRGERARVRSGTLTPMLYVGGDFASIGGQP